MDDASSSYKHIFMPDVLRNHVALVTGGGSGIGLKISEILIRHDCRVAIASRNKERLEKAVETLSALTKKGDRCIAVVMDVRKSNEVDSAIDSILKKWGRLDIVVNGAAGNFLCPASSLSTNGFRTVMEIDALGTFNVCKGAYNNYLKDHGGVIVNISATLHLNGMVLQSHAGAAKAAVDALTRHLAVEWGPDYVRVVGVAPGPIEGTPGFDKLGGEHLERVVRHIPLQKAGRTVDIAHLVLFLVSGAAALITGETVVADGGHWLGAGNSLAMIQELMGQSKL